MSCTVILDDAALEGKVADLKEPGLNTPQTAFTQGVQHLKFVSVIVKDFDR